MKLTAKFLQASLQAVVSAVVPALLGAGFLGLAPNAGFAAEGAAAPAAAKPDPAKGDTVFNATPADRQSCASCHNADGNSAIATNPKLAQQHPEYILKQLQDFKSGKRKSAIMKPMASALSEDDMRNIAWFVA